MKSVEVFKTMAHYCKLNEGWINPYDDSELCGICEHTTRLGNDNNVCCMDECPLLKERRKFIESPSYHPKGRWGVKERSV